MLTLLPCGKNICSERFRRAKLGDVYPIGSSKLAARSKRTSKKFGRCDDERHLEGRQPEAVEPVGYRKQRWNRRKHLLRRPEGACPSLRRRGERKDREGSVCNCHAHRRGRQRL